MSSINPVVLMPAALAARGAALGRGFVGSLTMGAGQFCTNPGLLLAIEGEGLSAFEAAAIEALGAHAPQPMLTGGIRAAYAEGTARLAPVIAAWSSSRPSSSDGVATKWRGCSQPTPRRYGPRPSWRTKCSAPPRSWSAAAISTK
ncbi:hypothetical protein AB5I41_27860 [Sphingomonas sp. MMS24-JH45]